MGICTCGHSHYRRPSPSVHAESRVRAHAVSPFRLDPTRTLTLRKGFSAEMYKRFRALKGKIIEVVGRRDVFGLSQPRTNQLPGERAFAFRNDAEKVEGFMAWLQGEIDRGIMTTQTIGDPEPGKPWTNMWVKRGYEKGIQRAQNESVEYVRQYKPEEGPLNTMSITAALNSPVHADRLRLLYTRTFSELRGITQAMDQQISRVLAEGLAAGQNPMAIARALNERVDKIGITRARTLARTEIIRAHHVASVQEYINLGITELGAEVEWTTAGFNVCPICQGLEGRRYQAEESFNLIPAHPNCRCTLKPIPPEEVEPLPERDVPGPGEALPTDLRADMARALQSGNIDEIGQLLVPYQKQMQEVASQTIPATMTKVEARALYDALDADWEQYSSAIARITSEGRFKPYRNGPDATFADILQAKKGAKPGLKKATGDQLMRLQIQHDHADTLYNLRKARRTAQQRWITQLPTDEYEQVRNALIDDMIAIPKAAPDALQFRVMTRNGMEYVPYDVLEELHRGGVKIKYNPVRGRAYHHGGSREIHLFKDELDAFMSTNPARKADAVATVAHETGHSIDHFFSNWKNVGGKWVDCEYVTAKDAKNFAAWFKKTRSDLKGVYMNGDGEFWRDNWISDYEGRIYSGMGDGVEWWTMNIQRYFASEYWFNREFQFILPGHTKTRNKARQTYELAKDRYPELMDFIIRKFGGRMFNSNLE